MNPKVWPRRAPGPWQVLGKCMMFPECSEPPPEKRFIYLSVQLIENEHEGSKRTVISFITQSMRALRTSRQCAQSMRALRTSGQCALHILNQSLAPEPQLDFFSLSLPNGGWPPPLGELGLQQRRSASTERRSSLTNLVSGATVSQRVEEGATGS